MSRTDTFSDLLRSLKFARYEREAALKVDRHSRQALSRKERGEILAKTAGRCHICGGAIEGKWEADHVFAHAGGGAHRADTRSRTYMMFTARPTNTRVTVSEINDWIIISTFAQRERTGVSVGDSAVDVLKARNR